MWLTVTILVCLADNEVTVTTWFVLTVWHGLLSDGMVCLADNDDMVCLADSDDMVCR